MAKEQNEESDDFDEVEPIDASRLPGGADYEHTEAGKQEIRAREILARTYKPGDELIVSLAFGPSSLFDEGEKLTFVAVSRNYYSPDDPDKSYLHLSEKKPGSYAYYGSLEVKREEPRPGESEVISISSRNVTLADKTLRKQRVEAWGDAEIGGKLQYIGTGR